MLDIPSVLFIPLSIPLFILARERLGEFGALAEPLAFPVEDVDGDGDEYSDDREDGGWPFELETVAWAADVAVD